MIKRGLIDKISENTVTLPKGTYSGTVIRSFPCRGVIRLSEFFHKEFNNDINKVSNVSKSDISRVYIPDSLLGLTKVYYTGLSLNEGIDIVTVNRIQNKKINFMEYRLIVDTYNLQLDEINLLNKLTEQYPNITCIDFTSLPPNNLSNRHVINNIVNIVSRFKKKCSLIFGNNQFSKEFVTIMYDILLIGSLEKINISSIVLSDSLLIRCISTYDEFYKWITSAEELFVIPSGDPDVGEVTNNTFYKSDVVVYLDMAGYSLMTGCNLNSKNIILNPTIFQTLGKCQYISLLGLTSDGTSLTDTTISACNFFSKAGLDLMDTYLIFLLESKSFYNKSQVTVNIDINNLIFKLTGIKKSTYIDNILGIYINNFIFDISKKNDNYYVLTMNDSNEYVIYQFNNLNEPTFLSSTVPSQNTDIIYHETDIYTAYYLQNLYNIQLKFLLK